MKLDQKIILATEQDREEILKLYQEQKGREFCPWTEEYPGNETIDFDLSRDALYVMKQEGKIVAAISLEEDQEVEKLSCWDPELAPGGELARLAVTPAMQNQGIGRIMLRFGMDEWKRRGCRSIHFLVNRYNEKAIRSYAVFGFRVVGQCSMYEQEFLCYEMELD